MLCIVFIAGMTCNGCPSTIEKTLNQIEGLSAVATLNLPIAAGVLYLFLGILLSPMIAASAMSFSSVSVILNALRLKSLEI